MTHSDPAVLALVAAMATSCVSRTEVFEDIPTLVEEPDCAGPPLTCAFPELPELENVAVEMRGDTAFVTFADVDGAVDYRVTALNDADRVRVNAEGRVIVDDAVYRCAGNRQIVTRARGDSTRADIAGLYTRDGAEAVLGHVFLVPGEGRVAVRRLADPRPDPGVGAGVPSVAESRAARYVPEGILVETLLAEGYRDDGVAFFAPTAANVTHPIHFWHSAPRPDQNGERFSLYVQEGAERDALAEDALTEVLEPEFRALDENAPESVPLRRVLYRGGHPHDVLAAGNAELERVLDQGNRPFTRLAFPGITEATTLVVEALDAGCPFAGHLLPEAAIAEGDLATSTLEAARLGSGEVFINGQHAPGSRPNAVARSLLPVAPEPLVDGVESFAQFPQVMEFTRTEPSPGVVRHEGSDWIVEASGTLAHYVGALLGQLWLGQSDAGGAGLLRLQPTARFALSTDAFTHVTLRLPLPATPRRHPQLLLRMGTNEVVIQPRGVPSADLAQAVRLELALCEGRAWLPDSPCPTAELEGRRIDDPSDPRPWAPVPVVAELAGFDLPVRLDVFVSTERAYLLLDERPAGCAMFPAGALSPGPLEVAFGNVSYASLDDEATVDESAPHQYLRTHSRGHDMRRFDDFGVVEGAVPPDWDEALFPCGTFASE